MNKEKAVKIGQKKLIGKVTEDEKNEVQALFERKNGLTELFQALASMSVDEQNNLYNRIVKDMSDVTAKMKKWWKEKSANYKWENVAGYKWEIDFDTCEIYLVKE